MHGLHARAWACMHSHRHHLSNNSPLNVKLHHQVRRSDRKIEPEDDPFSYFQTQTLSLSAVMAQRHAEMQKPKQTQHPDCIYSERLLNVGVGQPAEYIHGE